MNYLSLVLLFVLPCSVACGQKGQGRLFLVPSFGFQSGFCTALERPTDPNFRINNFPVRGEYGLGFQFVGSEKWTFALGVTLGASPFSFTYHSPGITRRQSRFNYGMPATRIFAGFQRTLGSSHHIGSNDSRLFRWLAFRIRMTGGVLVDKRFLILPGVELGMHNGTHTYYSLTTTGYGAYAGTTFQFHTEKRNHLQLSLLYTQGLRQMDEMDFEYFDGARQQNGKLATRGSFLSLVLAYPIRLI
jgi:hypothetical protein